MAVKNFIVLLEHPYFNDLGDIFNLDSKFRACAYTLEEINKHKNMYSITPINTCNFPCKTITCAELRRISRIKKFEYPYQMSKAINFTNFVNLYLDYIDICKNNSYKYYIKYNKDKIYFKNNNFYINKYNFYMNNYCMFEDELINMVFENYNNTDILKLKKFNIFYRLFYKLLNFVK